MKKKQIHKYADLFPSLEGDSLNLLADDIKANGQRLAIITDQEDRIVDGRNREAACLIGNVTPRYETRVFTSDREILSYVISLNLQRRHLNESQRSMVAAEIANMDMGLPNKDTNSNNTNNNSANLQNTKVVEVSQEEAAKLLNTSTRSVASAKKVMKSNNPKLQKAVKDGKIKVSKAAKIADLPKEEQEKAVDEMTNGKVKKNKTSNESDTTLFIEVLKWASQRKTVTNQDIASKFKMKPSYCQRCLTTATHCNGFIIKSLGEGEFRVQKAVHFSIRDENSPADLKGMMKHLHRLAEEALRLDNNPTSASWSQKERHNFLMKVMEITGPLAKG